MQRFLSFFVVFFFRVGGVFFFWGGGGGGSCICFFSYDMTCELYSKKRNTLSRRDLQVSDFQTCDLEKLKS